MLGDVTVKAECIREVTELGILDNPNRENSLIDLVKF